MVQSVVSRKLYSAVFGAVLTLMSTGCPSGETSPEADSAPSIDMGAAGSAAPVNPHAHHQAPETGVGGGHAGHVEATTPTETEAPVAHEGHDSNAADAAAPSAPEHTDHDVATDAPAAAPIETHEDHTPSQPPAAAGTGAGTAGSPAADSGTHSGHTPTATSGAPKITTVTFPMGEPGESTKNIGTSTEKPAVSDGVGAFRTVCDYSHMLYDDPIVFPGQPGKAHLHTFFGNTDADAYSTADSLRNSGNSTCRGGIANRSSYWVPSLIDAQGKPVVPTSMDVYYKSGYLGIAPKEIKTFPKGLRMIAGSAKASAPQEHAWWGCHQNYIGHPSTIPQCKQGDSLVMVIEFPQCWDGKNLDSADHMSHMSYPVAGKCPSTHPVAIPLISFNVLYPIRDVTGWRLSSDMYDATKPGGYSVHGDWFEGWDEDISKTFVENCVAKGVDCHSHLLGDGRTIR